MRVLLTVASLEPSYGGPAFSVSQLARALGKHGLDVGLWAPDQSAATSELVLTDDPVQRLTGTADEALDFLRSDGVLHDNGIWLSHNHHLAMGAKRRAVPRVISTRGMLEPWARRHKGLKKDLAWALYQKADSRSAALLHATATAEADNLALLALGPEIVVIPNGIERPPTRLPALAGKTGKTALFVGRLYPVKGLPMLVEAWARAAPEDWTLLIAGPDEAGHRSEVEATIARHGMAEQIRFLGPVSGAVKAQTYFDADLFVLPSYSESFGMAVGEALAHGLPVLTTTAVPWEGLEQVGSGWRVAPTVQGLEDGLRRACAVDKKSLSAMGEKGRTFVEQGLSWTGVAGRFAQLYEKLLSSR